MSDNRRPNDLSNFKIVSTKSSIRKAPRCRYQEYFCAKCQVFTSQNPHRRCQDLCIIEHCHQTRLVGSDLCSRHSQPPCPRCGVNYKMATDDMCSDCVDEEVEAGLAGFDTAPMSDSRRKRHIMDNRRRIRSTRMQKRREKDNVRAVQLARDVQNMHRQCERIRHQNLLVDRLDGMNAGKSIYEWSFPDHQFFNDFAACAPKNRKPPVIEEPYSGDETESTTSRYSLPSDTSCSSVSTLSPRTLTIVPPPDDVPDKPCDSEEEIEEIDFSDLE